MQKWKYVDQGENGEPVENVITEDEILAQYYPYWQKAMHRVGRAHFISPQHCIDDFVTVHWAGKA